MWKRLQDGFLFWVLAGAAWGWLWPEVAAPGRVAIPWALAGIMAAMGLTLTAAQFQDLRHYWRPALLGVALQYTVMPLAAVGLGWALGLAPDLAVGMVLVGAVPGGTASNVVTWLARGHVPLSVAMTVGSTLLCVLLTPLWVWAAAGQWVPVDPLGLLRSTALLVLLPVVCGMFVRKVIGLSERLREDVLPLLSIVLIAWIVGVIVAINHERMQLLPMVVTAVVLHNACGLAAGWWVAGLVRVPADVRRTIAIEVGMQNSGLAVALALKHFSAVAALPGVVFSVWHNVTGPLLAGIWRRRAE
ncbi:MAG: bile acid:sodium symporter family protein [Candidatus Dadabacteria bacterium]|nr:MAG: bile acid:sodium symporter family protein [Candidatus Dadabacteria bacterium]